MQQLPLLDPRLAAGRFPFDCASKKSTAALSGHPPTAIFPPYPSTHPRFAERTRGGHCDAFLGRDPDEPILLHAYRRRTKNRAPELRGDDGRSVRAMGHLRLLHLRRGSLVRSHGGLPDHRRRHNPNGREGLGEHVAGLHRAVVGDPAVRHLLRAAAVATQGPQQAVVHVFRERDRGLASDAHRDLRRGEGSTVRTER